MRFLVVIPTYNELENVRALVPELVKLDENIEVLVVDDNSLDGTGDAVKDIRADHDRVHLLERPGKLGLGKAYIAGFQWALRKKFDVVFEMDADFSHRPRDLEKLVHAIQTGPDFIVGSRYVPGGSTPNWGFLRQSISRGGSLYARCILRYPLKDWTGGFNGWKAEVLEALELEDIRSEGYCFQIELKYRALKKGFSGREVPILFEDRRVGQSKMSTRIVFEAFYRVWVLKLKV